MKPARLAAAPTFSKKSYGKPGRIVACHACGAADSAPNVNFICMDCSAVTSAEAAATTDWYHYELTDTGLNALREGRLPQREFSPTLEQSPRAYSAREFQLLAMQETRVARQYREAFSVARISFPNLETIRRDLGIVAVDSIFRRAVDMIVETVRPRDFVGTTSSQSVIIGLPGISPAGVLRIEGRIRQTIRDTIAPPLEVTVEVAEGDAIAQLFARR
jgi:GGDEF domain-containing protein